MRILLWAVLVSGLAGGAARAQVEVPVQPNLTAAGFNVEKTGTLIVVAWPYNAGGKVAVCGFVYDEGASTALSARRVDMLKNLVFNLGGKQTNARATAFAIFPTEKAALASGKGKCSVTRLPWNDRYAKERLEMSGRYNYIRG